jgi:ATP sulfurylase
MKSYQRLLEVGVYSESRMVLSSFYTYSRYRGPRDVVFTALCRKNMGYSFFVIVSDHTGIGDFFGPDYKRGALEERNYSRVVYQAANSRHSFIQDCCWIGNFSYIIDALVINETAALDFYIILEIFNFNIYVF